MRTTIEQQVMANVAVIYTARKIFSRTALKCYVLFLSVVGITFFISVPHVTQNFEHVMQGGVGSMAGFVLAAIVGTTLVVQIALLLGVVAFASLVVELFSTRRPAII